VSRKGSGDFLFHGRRGKGRCLSTRQYARLLSEWIASIGLDPALFGTHSLRRTKATLIYRRTGNLRAVQLLLGHTKVETGSGIWLHSQQESLKNVMRPLGLRDPFRISHYESALDDLAAEWDQLTEQIGVDRQREAYTAWAATPAAYRAP
jgi:hypothetical protein